jgi:3-oxoadipate enol-lactonase
MDFIALNGLTVHYAHQKSELPRTFVLVNSLGTDLRIWDAVADQLLTQGAVLRFDLAGHGLSEVPMQSQTIAGYGRTVIELLNALDIPTCVLVGLSIGGLIGQWVALEHPARLTHLVLSNTAPKIGTDEGWNARIQAVREQGLAAIADDILDRWFPLHFQQAHSIELVGYRRMLVETSVLGYVHACEAIRDADLTAQLPALGVPTLCLGGTDDLSTPPQLVQAMAALIPNARCEIISGLGHIPCLQTPELMAQLVLDFAVAAGH